MSSTDTTALGTNTSIPAEDPANTAAPQGAETQPQPTEGEPPAAELLKDGEAGAPETYQFTNPDGAEMSDVVLKAFGEAARELNLTQDGAQSIINAALPAMAEHAASLIQEQKNEWAEKARTDKEFGGSAFEKNLSDANEALGRFASPELISELKATGFGNHPEMVRMMLKVHQAISEDTILMGGATKGAERDLSDPDVQALAMYKTTHTH